MCQNVANSPYFRHDFGLIKVTNPKILSGGNHTGLDGPPKCSPACTLVFNPDHGAYKPTTRKTELNCVSGRENLKVFLEEQVQFLARGRTHRPGLSHDRGGKRVMTSAIGSGIK